MRPEELKPDLQSLRRVLSLWWCETEIKISFKPCWKCISTFFLIQKSNFTPPPQKKITPPVREFSHTFVFEGSFCDLFSSFSLHSPFPIYIYLYIILTACGYYSFRLCEIIHFIRWKYWKNIYTFWMESIFLHGEIRVSSGSGLIVCGSG